MAQVTPSTDFALRKWVESLTWVVTQSGVCSSFVEIENEVHDEECLRGLERRGPGWRRVVASMASMVVASMASMASMASNGGFDGVDGVVGGLVAWWRRWRRW